jgi:hypothetical protein
MKDKQIKNPPSSPPSLNYGGSKRLFEPSFAKASEGESGAFPAKAKKALRP